MPMEREAYENLLNELLNPELEQSRRTDILQQLRVDYNTVIEEHQDHTSRIEKLTTDNQDLIVSNSKLFRQIGLTGQPEEKEVQQKEFSETVKISDFEKEL